MWPCHLLALLPPLSELVFLISWCYLMGKAEHASLPAASCKKLLDDGHAHMLLSDATSRPQFHGHRTMHSGRGAGLGAGVTEGLHVLNYG